MATRVVPAEPRGPFWAQGLAPFDVLGEILSFAVRGLAVPRPGELQERWEGNGGTLTYRVPTAREAGIWSPQGATIAPDGTVYVVSGNGESSGAFDYSNAVIQLSPDVQSVRSYFAPSNWAALNASDTDLGSVGATLLPSLKVVVAIGKQGVAYLLKAEALGGVGAQLASRQVCPGAFGGTAWSRTTVYVPCTDGLYALSVSETSIDVAWHASRPALASPIIA